MHPPNRIRALRKARKMTLASLGEATGYDKSHMAYVEKSERALSLTMMRKIADALDVAPADLLVDDDAGLRLDDDERKIIASYRSLTDSDRRKMLSIAIALSAPEDDGDEDHTERVA